MIRKRRPPGLRRKVGIGVTTPRSMRLLRMRPTIETEAAMPSRVRRTKIFSLPARINASEELTMHREPTGAQQGRSLAQGGGGAPAFLPGKSGNPAGRVRG